LDPARTQRPAARGREALPRGGELLAGHAELHLPRGLEHLRPPLGPHGPAVRPVAPQQVTRDPRVIAGRGEGVAPLPCALEGGV